jgi:hypothetical protein
MAAEAERLAGRVPGVTRTLKLVQEPVKGLRTRTACGQPLAARTRRPQVVGEMRM